MVRRRRFVSDAIVPETVLPVPQPKISQACEAISPVVFAFGLRPRDVHEGNCRAHCAAPKKIRFGDSSIRQPVAHLALATTDSRFGSRDALPATGFGVSPFRSPI